jgi:hypothetical protein
MFALRDFGAASKEAVLALAEGFGDASALFRYVPPLSYPSVSPCPHWSRVKSVVHPHQPRWDTFPSGSISGH